MNITTNTMELALEAPAIELGKACGYYPPGGGRFGLGYHFLVRRFHRGPRLSSPFRIVPLVGRSHIINLNQQPMNPKKNASQPVALWLLISAVFAAWILSGCGPVDPEREYPCTLVVGTCHPDPFTSGLQVRDGYGRVHNMRVAPYDARKWQIGDSIPCY